MNEFFPDYLKSKNIYFKHAKGISDHSGKEFHLFHEIILFLGAEAEFISETIHTKIEPNTLIVIPKETYHQLIIKGNQKEYHRCVFQFFESENNKNFINNTIPNIIITNSDKYISLLFNKMIQLSKDTANDYSSNISEAVLTLILDAIRRKDSLSTNSQFKDELTTTAINFIADRLTENINVDVIANHLNISPSTLMHTFKKNMNISIHKYIIKKRLILAHSRIEDGEPALTVAAECGFNDYSGFYRQYKKMFDISPSDTKKHSV